MSRMGTRSYVTREKKEVVFFFLLSKRKSPPSSTLSVSLSLSFSGNPRAACNSRAIHFERNVPNDLGNPEALRDDLWVDYN